MLGITAIASAQNYALEFDGTDDYIDCGTSLSYEVSGTAVTVEAWIYPTERGVNSYDYTIFSNLSNLIRGISFRYGGGKLEFVFGNGSYSSVHSDNEVLLLNTWQHVAAVYNGTTIVLYVNGSAVAASGTSISPSISMSGNNAIIGNPGNTDGYYMKGRLEEIRVWSDARSQTEIQNNMNFELTGGEAGLLAYYKLDETTGVTADNAEGTAGYDGTLTAINYFNFEDNLVSSQVLIDG